MRKINLTNKRLRYQRLLQKRFPSFRNVGFYGSFLRKKRELFKNFAIRRRIFSRSLSSNKNYRLAVVLKGTRFLKLLIKNTQFIRRFYSDMRQRELEIWGKKFRQGFKEQKRFGFINLLLNLDLRLNVSLLQQGFVNTVNQWKQFILHGKVLVNNKIIKGYHYRVHLLDFVTLSPEASLNFKLHRSWQRFFYFKISRLNLKVKSLVITSLRLNLLREPCFSFFSLLHYNKLDYFLTNNFIQNKWLKNYIIYFNKKKSSKGLVNLFNKKIVLNQWNQNLIYNFWNFHFKNSLNLNFNDFLANQNFFYQLKETRQKQLFWRWLLLLQLFSYNWTLISDFFFINNKNCD